MPFKNKEQKRAYDKLRCRTPEYKQKEAIRRKTKHHKDLIARLNKKYRENNPDSITEYRKRNFIPILLSEIKSRAKKKNLEFNLTVDDIVIPEKCPMLGIPIIVGSLKHRFAVDRIDNTKGYTRDNIQIISHRANRIKSDATLEELQQIVTYLKLSTE